MLDERTVEGTVSQPQALILPQRLLDRPQVRHRFLALRPPGGVQVKTLAGALFIYAPAGGQRRRKLEQRGFQFLAHPQLCQRRGDVEHKERARLIRGQAGQGGSIAIQQRDATARALLGIHRHARRAQCFHIAVNGALRGFQFFRQCARRHFAACLQQHRKG